MSGISIYEVRYVLQGNLDIFVQRWVNNCARFVLQGYFVCRGVWRPSAALCVSPTG
jgi:hypothetical protein